MDLDKSGVHGPIELSPVPNAYVTISSGIAVGLPVILWMVATAQGKTASIASLAFAPAALAIMVFCLKNMTVRLDDAGISKGLPALGSFIPYERVERASKEVQLRRGSPTVLVVSERDSGRRIVISLAALDPTALAQAMTELARRAPQAQIEEALTYAQLRRR